jgi:ferredoxin-NADP reductase/DMSO/TMAO reductase YedYZ heme-binding membrane subunit
MTLRADARASGPVAGSRVSERSALLVIGLGAIASGAMAFLGAPIPPPVVPTIAHLSGMWAGYGVAVMLLLMARIPAVERGVGADRLARWHAKGGRTILVLVLLHGATATLGWMQAQATDPVSATVQVLGMPGLLAATAATAIFCAIGVVSARSARKRLSYETWHALHLSTYLAVGLSFAHELAGPNLAGHRVAQIWWSLLYTASFALVLRFRFIEPLLRTARHRMRVERVVQESPAVVSLHIRGRHLSELGAEPGQFFRWRFLTARTWHQANPFSLSSPPTDRQLRLTVEAVGAGTRALHRIQPGTRVLAEGPYGAMTEHRRTGRGVLLLAGGVGITPMRAMFQTVDVTRGPVTLLYRASRTDDLIFVEELRAIAIARRMELRFIVGRSSDPTKAITRENLRRWIPDVARRDVFMCASPRFASAARGALLDAGVPARRIHHEEFAF